MDSPIVFYIFNGAGLILSLAAFRQMLEIYEHSREEIQPKEK